MGPGIVYQKEAGLPALCHERSGSYFHHGMHLVRRTDTDSLTRLEEAAEYAALEEVEWLSFPWLSRLAHRLLNTAKGFFLSC
jgi:hypothetical protein